MKSKDLALSGILSQRIKALRQTLGKTQRDMAAWAGVTPLGWHKYEAGDNLPGATVLASMREKGVNINWLLGGDGPMRLYMNFTPDEPAAPSDQDILKEAINAVESWLATNSRALPPEKKAEIYTHIYAEALAAPDGRVSADKVANLLKLIAG